MGFGTQEKGGSIFEMAATSSSKKKTLEPALPVDQPVVEPVKKASESDEELRLHWERCRAMYRELDRQIDALFSTTSVTPSKLSSFLSNPKNFNKEQWKALEDVKKINIEKFTSLCKQMPTFGEELVQQYLKKSSTQKQLKALRHSQEKIKGKKPPPRHQWLEMH